MTESAPTPPVDPTTLDSYVAPEPTPTNQLPLGADVRLVAVDMDGTLLDEDKNLPDGLSHLLARMHERGIVFAPASGRQYATLLDMFTEFASDMTFIAENGALVMRNGREVSSTPVDRNAVESSIHGLRQAVADGANAGVVLCCVHAAYVERSDEPFLERARPYYHELRVVDDLLEVDDTPIKVAIFDFVDVTPVAARVLAEFESTHEVVISGLNWADLMTAGVDKGQALIALRDSMGITREQTAAFGDYLNDLGMIQESGLSFAMANAHPDLIAAARYIAPSNADNGVVRVMEHVLG